MLGLGNLPSNQAFVLESWNYWQAKIHIAHGILTWWIDDKLNNHVALIFLVRWALGPKWPLVSWLYPLCGAKVIAWRLKEQAFFCTFCVWVSVCTRTLYLNDLVSNPTWWEVRINISGLGEDDPEWGSFSCSRRPNAITSFLEPRAVNAALYPLLFNCYFKSTILFKLLSF